jgi:preprotein translocase subunit SecA
MVVTEGRSIRCWFRLSRDSRSWIRGTAHRLYPRLTNRFTLRTIDDAWADHLARVSEYRSGVQWVSMSGRDPHREYLLKIDEWFRELEAGLPDEIARRVESDGAGTADRGAVWIVSDDRPAVWALET